MRPDTPAFATSRPGLKIGLVIASLFVGAVTLVAIGRGASRDPPGRTEAAPEAKFFWEISPRPDSLVPLDEIVPGGPPPDGIPPIDEPRFVSTREVPWLTDTEPVILLRLGRQSRVYPLQILTWHEIVNDTIGSRPVTVTFCPLCNSALAFDRRVQPTPDARRMLGSDETVLDFGTSGRLYQSNLVMYDRQTKSMWIQFTGQSIVGPFMGAKLEMIPVQIVSWEQVRRDHPDAMVLSRDTGHRRDYGRNPYVGYDDVDSFPFLFEGPTDDRLRPMDRIVTLVRGEQAVAYPLTWLTGQARRGVAAINDEVGGEPIAVLWKSGTTSALDDSSIAASRDVGATGVFSRTLGDRTLTFGVDDGRIIDEQTRSSWSVLGRAESGELAGAELTPLVHDDTFWFVWAAFRPETEVRTGR